MERIANEEMRDRAKYLTDLPYFKLLSFPQRKKICKNSTYHSYHRNQIVFEQEVFPEYVYIVVKGEFEI